MFSNWFDFRSRWRQTSRKCASSRPQLERLEQRIGPAVVTINTTNLTVTGADTTSNTFYGVPYEASVVNGVAQFAIEGDLNVPPGDTIQAVGDLPVKLLVGNNVIMPTGSVFDFSGSGATPGPGGPRGRQRRQRRRGRGGWLRRQRRCWRRRGCRPGHHRRDWLHGFLRRRQRQWLRWFRGPGRGNGC